MASCSGCFAFDGETAGSRVITSKDHPNRDEEEDGAAGDREGAGREMQEPGQQAAEEEEDTATVPAVVSIFHRTRRLVASGIPAVAWRNGTSANLGPIPIRSSRKMSKRSSR